jgi:biopolymer transport protein ExbD
MRSKREKKHIVAKIDITPFTDVVLVLLIIFMVATPIISQGKISVNLPDATVAKSQDKPESVIVYVQDSGVAYLDDQPFNLPAEEEAFRAAFTTKLAAAKDPAVVINGDKNVRYDAIVQVVDIMGDLKVRKLMLGTNVKVAKK